MRLPPLYEGQSAPLTAIDYSGYADWTGDPDAVRVERPQAVQERLYAQSQENTTIKGYMPAYNHLRVGWSAVDGVIANRKAAPIGLEGSEGTYHPEVDHAFTSLALGHALCSLRFKQRVRSVLPGPMGSVFSGAA